MNSSKIKIAVIGLGYVGLPLAVEFGKKYSTVGYDICSTRVKDLNNFIDHTLEIESEHLKEVLQNGFFSATDSIFELSDCNIFIVTVPTPTDKNNRPVLTPLIKASEIVGSLLKKGDIVVYECTVYPGVTEDECVPILEKTSSLVFNNDFFVGYSPERINPGDKIHSLTKILKVTSGSTPEIAEIIDQLYKSIIDAGTHKAPSIKVAEAAKVIENAQRDINIAFVNELAKIFSLLEIDTDDVLSAAGTKWNFLKFKPGLVGGHCIGVDPYYLAQKSQEVGYHPEIILAGRRLNDSMGGYVADTVVKLMLKKGIQVIGSKILILGFTFKENCPDVRNTRVIDIVKTLKSYNTDLTVFDPWANSKEVEKDYGIISTTSKFEIIHKQFEAIILAVAHDEFKELDFLKLKKSDKSVIFDVKGFLPKAIVDARL